MCKYLERLVILFTFLGKSVELGAFYRPYRGFQKFLEAFQNNLQTLVVECDTVFCLGDFNVEMLSDDSFCFFDLRRTKILMALLVAQYVLKL